MISLEKIKEQFVNKGYKEVSTYKKASELLWKPDLFFSKNNSIYLVLIKTNNSIPPSFLARISKIPKGNVIPLIIFSQRLESKKDEQSILSLGISLGYFIRGKLVDFRIKRKRSEKSVKKEIRKKLKVIDIFLSSKQDIVEREFIKGRILVLRDTYNYPFFLHMIEYDRFDMKKLYEHINQEIKKCEWMIVLLEDHRSEVVSYEIKKCLKLIEHKNIFMFVKSTSECKRQWERELKKINNLENKSVHYNPYFNLNDLEVTLSKAINSRMNEICKKENIALFN